MTWRARSVEIILRVVEENPGLSGEALRRKVSEEYPFGGRSGWPYKAWLAAVEATLGPSPKKIEAVRTREEEDRRRTGQGVLTLE